MAAAPAATAAAAAQAARAGRPRLAWPARPHGGGEQGRPGDGAPRRGGTGAAAGRALCPGAASGGRDGGSPPAGSRSPGGRLQGMCLPPAGCQPSREHKIELHSFSLITGPFLFCFPPPPSPTPSRSPRGLLKFSSAPLAGETSKMAGRRLLNASSRSQCLGRGA